MLGLHAQHSHLPDLVAPGAFLSGAGSPEGVVVASPGAVYADESVTRGASLWQKISGVGNTGWRVVRGDTGWLRVRAWDAAGVVTGDPFPAGYGPRAGVAGDVQMRRVNNIVFIGFQFVEILVTSTVDRVYIAPAGFTAPTMMNNFVQSAVGTPNVNMFAFSPRLLRASVTWPAGTYFQGVCVSYVTDDNWPTALPPVV